MVEDSGGGISLKIGDYLYAAGVKLYDSYETTESSLSTHVSKQTEEDESAWAYMKFGAHTNIRWMPQGDGTYKCQFKVSGLVVALNISNLLIYGLDMQYIYLGS